MIFKRMVAVMISTVMFGTFSIIPNNYFYLTTSATQSMSSNFYGGYTLTGDGAADIVSVGMAQKGRSQASMGYSEAWCADFVSDCAKIAGQSDAVPFSGSVAAVYDGVIKAGGYVVSSPQTGDLVFYDGYCHVGIMTDSVNSIQGNVDSQVYYMNPSRYINENGYSVSYFFVRPNYKGNSNLVDLGDNFTAYITNTSSLKVLTNESNNNVDIMPDKHKAEQYWYFTKRSDGSYRITNCKTGNVLDAGGTEGNLYTYADYGNDYQSWYICGSDGAYRLKSKNSDKVIDIANASEDDGANARMYDPNGTKAQSFQIYKVDNGSGFGTVKDLGKEFTAYIQNVNSGMNLVIDSKTFSAEGVGVEYNNIIQSASIGNDRLWSFVMKDDGSYSISNCESGLVLDSGGKNGNLYAHTDCDNECQSWYIFGEKDSYRLKAQDASNGVIDISNASTEEGANAWVFESNGTKAQMFKIVKVEDFIVTTTTTTTTTQSTTTTVSSTTTTDQPISTTSPAASVSDTTTTTTASVASTTSSTVGTVTTTASETALNSSTTSVTSAEEIATSSTASATETGTSSTTSVSSSSSNATSTASSTSTSQTTAASTTSESGTTTTETTPIHPADTDLGDVNEDGKVDAKDASIVLVAYAKVSTGSEEGLTEKQRKSADVNADGKIDAKDSSSMLAYYALVSTSSGDFPTMKEFMAPKKA